jgi:hypothetical protein
MMSSSSVDPPDFLSQDPAPAGAEQEAAGSPVLPEAVVSKLMAIPGVDGVWIEKASDGRSEVVIYVTDAQALSRLPTIVQGLVVRPQVGEPIKALRSKP